MDIQVKNYADSLYGQAQMTSLGTMNDARIEFLHRRSKPSGQQPLGGTEIGAMIKFYVQHIERCMSARLESYRTAYSESERDPTDEEFTKILEAVQDLQQRQVKQAAAAISSFIQSRGGAQMGGDTTASLMAGSAHGHDRVLREWKVWRDKVRVKRDHKASAASKPDPIPFHAVISALGLLHPDFKDYAHYLNEDKLKEAVAAAFERYENRLNEIRDKSRKVSVRNSAGKDLVYQLFNSGVLRLPYNKLGRNAAAKTAYEQALTSMLSGGLGWIRNAYSHEKHKLPEIDEVEALELLFVASYLMRMLRLSER